MNSNLSDLQTLVAELKTTNSSNDKVAILKRHPECKALLFYTYNPFFRFYVSAGNVSKRMSLMGEGIHFENLIDLLDSLRARRITGNKAIASVGQFISENRDYEDLILQVLGRNLECRIEGGLINKAFPNLIPGMNVALACNYRDCEKTVNFERDSWYASRKLDGCRCNMIIDDTGEVSCWSRGGREFTTLGNLIKEFKQEFPDAKNLVFDGEICILDQDENENFQAVMKEIKRKDHTIERPCLMIFDMLSLSEFYGTSQSGILSQRFSKMKEFFERKSLKTMKILPQTKIASKADFNRLVEEAESHPEWEGLILRKDAPYEGKRTKNMLKVKSFNDAEYKVLEIVPGPIRVINDGVEVSEIMLSNVIIEHKGYRVSVGSGWSLAERRLYHAHPEQLLGKLICVKYFEETTDQLGNLSLRFPTLKYVVGEKRDV